jgi:acetyl-CoA C-acetyltransferase
MDFKQLDCLEINEGFATQALANEKMLRWDRSKVNVHGGAIALGHPSGMSGARIILSLYHALRSQGKEIGGAAITGAGGVATALIIKYES